jgi:phosphotriesterase-related protein
MAEAMIHTVLGALKPNDLGWCQIHEHLSLVQGYLCTLNPDFLIDDREKTLNELGMYRRAGGRSVVDAQPVGCCRDAGELAALSKGAGVNVVASTGFHRRGFYPENHWLFGCDSGELEELFVSELLEGMFAGCDVIRPGRQTAIRAGVIKTACDANGMDGVSAKLFSAAAKASVSTGAPIMVHTERGSRPTEVLNFLLDRGAAPDRIIFCHMDRSCPDLSIHENILSEGAYLEYDTIGRPKYHDDADEITIIKTALEKGYEDRIMCSLDVTRARLKAYTPGAIGLDYILTAFKDKMRDGGITATQIQKMTEFNSAAVLAW